MILDAALTGSSPVSRTDPLAGWTQGEGPNLTYTRNFGLFKTGSTVVGGRSGRQMPATGQNQHWSMDFAHDQILDGRVSRVLAVIDQWSRRSVPPEANFRLSGRCVGTALDEAACSVDGPSRSLRITVRNSHPRHSMNGSGAAV
jgi:transposase InsO family protein